MRNGSLDALKLSMAVMVVGLHGNFLSELTPTLSWVTVNGLFRIAVPAFLIINGYFFAGILETQSVRRQWFRRVASLYLTWMSIYAVIWIPDVTSVAKGLYYAAIGWFHLWYLAGMICAGFMLTLLRRRPSRDIVGISAVLFCLGVAIQYVGILNVLDGAADQIVDKNPTHRNFLFFSFPFFAAGYLIRIHHVIERVSLRWSVKAMGVGFSLLMLESLLVLRLADEGVTVDNYFSLVVAAPSVFLFAAKLSLNMDSGKRISLIANGIYFIHPLFLIGLGISRSMPPTAASIGALLLSAMLAAAITQSKVLTARLL